MQRGARGSHRARRRYLMEITGAAGTMPAYLVSVAAANYAVARDTLATVIGGRCRSSSSRHLDTADMRASFTHLPDAFARISRRSSGPYRWEKVGYVLTPVGAMEHSTSIHYRLPSPMARWTMKPPWP